MMDAIDDEGVMKLNSLVLHHTKDIVNNTIDIVYFDATTLYFESFSEDTFTFFLPVVFHDIFCLSLSVPRKSFTSINQFC